MNRAYVLFLYKAYALFQFVKNTKIKIIIEIN